MFKALHIAEKKFKSIFFVYVIFLSELILTSIVFACEAPQYDTRNQNTAYYNVKASINDTCRLLFNDGNVAAYSSLGSVLTDAGLQYEKYDTEHAKGYIVRTKDAGDYEFTYFMQYNASASNQPYTIKYVFSIHVAAQYSKSQSTSKSSVSSSSTESQNSTGSAESDSSLGGRYNDGYKLYEKHDFAGALVIWQSLSDKNYALAQYAVGLMHYRGEGVPTDHEKGISLIQLAAGQGYLKAEVSLAEIYELIDVSKSAKWYNIAARQGDLKSQYKIGYFSYYGIPDQVNIINAYVWASISAKANYDGAKSLLSKVIDDLSAKDLLAAQELAKRCTDTKFKDCPGLELEGTKNEKSGLNKPKTEDIQKLIKTTSDANLTECTDANASLKTLGEACDRVIKSGQVSGVSLAKAYFGRGRFFTSEDQFSKAVDDYTRAIEINPDVASYNNRASAFRQMGNFDEAQADYQKALQFNQSYPLAHAGLGAILIEKGKFIDAVKELDFALTVRPSLSFAHFQYGKYYYYQANYDSSILSFTTAINNDDGSHGLYYAWRAQSYLAKNDINSAVSDSEKAMALSPKDKFVLDIRDQVAFKKIPNN